MAVETLLEPLHEITHRAVIAGGSSRPPERRRNGRSRIAGPHAVTVSINEWNAALVANLSESGMRLQALGRRLQPGARLRVKFRLPGSPETIRARGVVAWVNDVAEAGIRFTKLPEFWVLRLRAWRTKNNLGNAARGFMYVAGGWQAALDLTAEVTHLLIGASSVAITLVALGNYPICSWVDEGLPVRETVAAAIYQNERIVGHLEISSPTLGAFGEEDLGALSMLAAVVSEMLRMRAEIAERRAAEQQEIPPKASRLSTIVSRIEDMIPTIRVRLVL